MRPTEKIDIFSPCYDGSRFEEHRFPLELMEDLFALRNMTIEMAKAIYLENNKNRKRVPRNFTNGISIELESIQPGSTIPKVVLIAALSGLFPHENTHYFTEAPQRIIRAIEAAHLDQNFKDALPSSILKYFNQLGSNLKEDERIIFGEKNNSKAILDKESRKRLVLAASETKEYNGPYELRGIVTALDKERKLFEVQTITGFKLKGEYTPQYLEVLQAAFVEMELGRKVLIKGIGAFNASDKLLKIESMNDATCLDILDVPARLEELAQLKQGWYDGFYGEPFDEAALNELGNDFDQFYDSENLPLPATFPTTDGNIQFEWSSKGCEISLSVEPESKKGEFFSLNTIDKTETSEELDLNTDQSWIKLNQLIQALHG